MMMENAKHVSLGDSFYPDARRFLALLLTFFTCVKTRIDKPIKSLAVSINSSAMASGIAF
jgi:hypothetical protein